MDPEIPDLVHKSLTGMALTPERSLTYERNLCFMGLVASHVGSWLVDWLVGWLFGWLDGWLIGWFFVWLDGWLVGWLDG